MFPLPRLSSGRSSRLLCVLLLATAPLLSGCFGVKIKKLRADKQMLEAHVMQLQQDLTACQEQTLNAQAKAKATDTQTQELDTLRQQLRRTQDDLAATKLAMTKASDSGAKEFAGRLSQSLETEQALKEKIERLETEVSTRDVRETKLEQEITDLKDQLGRQTADAADLRLRLEKAGRDLETTSKRLADRESAQEKAGAAEAALREQLRAAQDQVTKLGADLKAATDKATAKESELAAATSARSALDGEKASLQKQIDELKAAQEKAVKDAEARVMATMPKRVGADAIASAEAAAGKALASAVTAGNARVSRTEDGIAIALASDALFKPGTTLLSDSGMALLKAASEAVKETPYRVLEVAGHTDDVPVKNMPYPDNWELAAARATEVTRWMAGQQGIPPAKMVAQSHAWYRPADPAKTAEARKVNRRVEIVVRLEAK